jgi:hypothetical protein
LSDEEVCIGDRYRIGSALLEVTQPRVTCYRVGIRMDEPRMAAMPELPPMTTTVWQTSSSSSVWSLFMPQNPAADLVPAGFCFELPTERHPFTSSFATASHKTSGLSSPAFASSIILLAISSSFAISPRSASPRARRVISNARPIIRLVSRSNLESPKNCEMGMEIGPTIGACARRPPAGTGGSCTAGDPDSFGSEAASRPTGMSPGVDVRFSYLEAPRTVRTVTQPVGRKRGGRRMGGRRRARRGLIERDRRISRIQRVPVGWGKYLPPDRFRRTDGPIGRSVCIGTEYL